MIVLGVLVALTVLSYVLFGLGGESPDRGKGDRIGLTRLS